jgi:hypothetical protein
LVEYRQKKYIYQKLTPFFRSKSQPAEPQSIIPEPHVCDSKNSPRIDLEDEYSPYQLSMSINLQPT